MRNMYHIAEKHQQKIILDKILKKVNCALKFETVIQLLKIPANVSEVYRQCHKEHSISVQAHFRAHSVSS